MSEGVPFVSCSIRTYTVPRLSLNIFFTNFLLPLAGYFILDACFKEHSCFSEVFHKITFDSSLLIKQELNIFSFHLFSVPLKPFSSIMKSGYKFSQSGNRLVTSFDTLEPHNRSHFNKFLLNVLLK